MCCKGKAAEMRFSRFAEISRKKKVRSSLPRTLSVLISCIESEEASQSNYILESWTRDICVICKTVYHVLFYYSVFTSCLKLTFQFHLTVQR